MKQVLSVLVYCHSNNIAHRDLKPENMLLEKKPEASDGSDLQIRVIDFGTSILFDPKKRMSRM
jgi:serine/threonine protein kinase